MRRLVWLLIAIAAPLSADALRVTAPHPGTVLRGGTYATLEWSAAALPAHAEEWEAFLSIDGGRYYAFRITPHLDLKLRRIEFAVPNVDAASARILIRTGDERDERAYELPWTFSIRRTDGAELPVGAAMSPLRGEAARDGDPDVVAWAEGDRAGTRVAQRRGGETSVPALRAVVSEAIESSPITAPKTLRARVTARIAAPLDAVSTRLALYAAQQVPPADLLLACRRRNV